jgi:large-conductance mechanosensitive channel
MSGKIKGIPSKNTFDEIIEFFGTVLDGSLEFLVIALAIACTFCFLSHVKMIQEYTSQEAAKQEGRNADFFSSLPR